MPTLKCILAVLISKSNYSIADINILTLGMLKSTTTSLNLSKEDNDTEYYLYARMGTSTPCSYTFPSTISSYLDCSTPELPIAVWPNLVVSCLRLTHTQLVLID